MTQMKMKFCGTMFLFLSLFMIVTPALAATDFMGILRTMKQPVELYNAKQLPNNAGTEITLTDANHHGVLVTMDGKTQQISLREPFSPTDIQTLTAGSADEKQVLSVLISVQPAASAKPTGIQVTYPHKLVSDVIDVLQKRN